MSLWTVGIDPGKTGAIAVLDGHGALIRIVDMPYDGGEVNAAALDDTFNAIAGERDRAGADLRVWIERQQSRPSQAAGAMFRFAQGYGTLLGLVAAWHWRCERVTPAKWKRSMGLSKDKGASRRLAGELWPDWSTSFARVKDDGRAEAALIAEYGRRQELRT